MPYPRKVAKKTSADRSAARRRVGDRTDHRRRTPSGHSFLNLKKFGAIKQYPRRPERIENVMTVASSAGLSSSTGRMAKAMATGMRKLWT